MSNLLKFKKVSFHICQILATKSAHIKTHRKQNHDPIFNKKIQIEKKYKSAPLHLI